MIKRILTLLLCIFALTLAAFSADSKKSAGPAPDKAYLQRLLDGWNSMNPSVMTQYYAQGDRLFFDIAPLKYNNWTEYQNGVTGLLKSYKSFKLSMTDDVQIHHEGDIAWTAAALKEEAATSTGKQEMATMRWTVIFQKMDGKWLIVHEHTSEALQ